MTVSILCADTHCHLDDPAFKDDLPAVIERARAAGIHPLIAPGETAESSARVLDIAAAHPSVRPCVGVHPHKAGDMREDQRAWFEEASRRPGVVGIGEIGLDYYYEFSARDRQREVCEFFLDLAGRRNLPACIHVRDKDSQSVAFEDLLAMIRPKSGTLRGVIHCFTGTFDQARAFLDLGLHLSFTGILTFAKAGPLRETFARLPEDRILLETDSPYLAPSPARGKRNEPARLRDVFSVAANCRNLPEPDWSRRLRETERALFSIHCDTETSVLEG